MLLHALWRLSDSATGTDPLNYSVRQQFWGIVWINWAICFSMKGKLSTHLRSMYLSKSRCDIGNEYKIFLKPRPSWKSCLYLKVLILLIHQVIDMKSGISGQIFGGNVGDKYSSIVILLICRSKRMSVVRSITGKGEHAEIVSRKYFII